MTRSTRVGVAGASLGLLALLVLPLWRIELRAPQYPEGLGMVIWTSTITGQKPQDLNSINGLNHYIGMKPIQPESIPELRFMPWIVIGLSITGLGVAASGRRSLLYAWSAVFALIGAAGLADFWRWGYDYGHDLNPTAAIKVPGMTYQPPLLGTKKLLNFEAVSLPAWGGWIAIAALALVLGLATREFLRHRHRAAPGPASGETGAIVLAA